MYYTIIVHVFDQIVKVPNINYIMNIKPCVSSTVASTVIGPSPADSLVGTASTLGVASSAVFPPSSSFLVSSANGSESPDKNSF